jgi:hypothetical protein
MQDNKSSSHSSVNWPKFFFFYLWMVLIYAYSFYVLWFVNGFLRVQPSSCFPLIILGYCGRFVHDRIRTGIEETLQARMNYIRRARICKSPSITAGLVRSSHFDGAYTCTDTIGYSLFWTLVFVLEFVDFLGALKADSKPRSSIRTTIAFVLASRGIWSLAILIIGNYEDLKLLHVVNAHVARGCRLVGF